MTKDSVKIILNTIKDIKDFSGITSRYTSELSLSSGRYIVDAKSIMGIFSLDLSKPISLEFDSIYMPAIVADFGRWIVA